MKTKKRVILIANQYREVSSTFMLTKVFLYSLHIISKYFKQIFIDVHLIKTKLYNSLKNVDDLNYLFDQLKLSQSGCSIIKFSIGIHLWMPLFASLKYKPYSKGGQM